MSAARVRIIVDDCRRALADLAPESVQCVVTSPPYWGLRDYGVAGQIGLEASVDAHIAALVAVFRDVRRVLRKDGTLWLNYGDAYASSVNGRSAADTKAAGDDDRTFRDKPLDTVKASGLKAKDLLGLPWRLAFALQADGWWLRRDIIWHKPNPMPESTRDRPTTAHEYVFLLTKAPRYFYDGDAIRTELAPNSIARLAQDIDGQEGSDRAHAGEKSNGRMKAVGGPRALYKMPDGWDTGAGGHRSIHRAGREKGAPPDRSVGVGHNARPRKAAPNMRNGFRGEHDGPSAYVGQKGTQSNSNRNALKMDGHVDRRKDGFNQRWDESEALGVVAPGANARSVWTIPTEGFKDAHFATFPTEMARRCILAGSRIGDTVLDPFGGAGTTGLVAAKALRNAILLELNPDYAAIAHRRMKSALIAVEGGDPARGLSATPLETAIAEAALPSLEGQ